MDFIVRHQAKEGRKNSSKKWSIEWRDTIIHHVWRVKTKTVVCQCGNQTANHTSNTSFSVANEDGNQDKQTKEWVIDKHCLK